MDRKAFVALECTVRLELSIVSTYSNLKFEHRDFGNEGKILFFEEHFSALLTGPSTELHFNFIGFVSLLLDL